MSPLLTRRFTDACAYALDVHRTQRRKGTSIPYASHLLSVAAIVMEAGGDESESIAALLHDAAEDAEDGDGLAALAKIRGRFGDEVADIVAHCSDTFEKPKPAWLARKIRYAQTLATADASTLLVSAADKLHNARATLVDLRYGDPETIWSRFSATRDQTLANYDRLIAAYEAGVTDPRRGRIVAELKRTVEEMKGY